MIAKPSNTKKSNFSCYISVSILVHLVIVGVLLYGAFFVERTILTDGNDSIKAVMIDLSVMAAPKQSLVENTPKTETDTDEVNKDHVVEVKPEDVKKVPEVEPDLIAEKKINEKRPDPQLVIKQKTLKPKDQHKNKQAAQKISKQQVRQEIMTDKLADNAVAPDISNNTQYSATPAVISRNHPEYPRKALDLRIEGYVIAVYDIDSTGKVENIRIVESKPSNIFNKTVIQAMQQWKYQPIQAKDLTIKIVFNRNKSVNFDKA